MLIYIITLTTRKTIQGKDNIYNLNLQRVILLRKQMKPNEQQR